MADAQSHERFIEVGGTKLHSASRGSGPALLLVHAANLDLRMWEGVSAALSPRYRVIRYDMRGMGLSEMGTRGYSAHGDIEGLLDALGVEETAIVGASAGGYCALEFALTHPSRLWALALVSAGLFESEIPESPEYRRLAGELGAAIASGDLDAMAERYARMWLDGPGQPPSRVAPEIRSRFFAMAREAFARRAEYRFPDLLAPGPRGRLHEIARPTLVVHGELDFPELRSFAELFAREIRGATRVRMPGVAHLPPLEQPEEFSRILARFLAVAEAAR